ncbi:MAG: ABC transporter ATP-binding protein/permease [Lachnospiraceae bacterium]|nr:ABC transporter ATP-binding protein/permease [Lachnospiraceae bacterium]
MKKYLNTIRWYIVGTIAANFIEAVISALMLLFPGWLIDNYQKGFAYTGKLLAAYAGVFLIYLVEAYCSNRLADYRRIRFEKAIKKDFFNAVIQRDFGTFHQYDVAEYISMQANDITEMCQNYLSPLLSIIRSVMMIAVYGVFLVIFVDISIAMVILIFSVAVVFVPKLTEKDLAKRNKGYMDGIGRYTASAKLLYEAHDILDFKGRKKLTELHDGELDHVLNLNMHFRKLNSLAMVLNGGSVEAIGVIVFAVVAILLGNHVITLGMAVNAFTYSTKFIDPMYEMNVCIGMVNSVREIQKKLLEIIGSGMDDVPADLPAVAEIHRISATAMEKHYDGADIRTPAAELSFPKKYLVLGENGAGKSVFFRLLMHFEEADSGAVFYNGCKESDFISESICYVPQVPVIFNASYLENVTVYGAYDEENLKEYESYFPADMISHIKSSTNPLNMSGGEKQVVALLRALCSGKDMIFLDEPFAAMNQHTIDEFMKHIAQINRTFVIIAHNLEPYAEQFDEQIWICREM